MIKEMSIALKSNEYLEKIVNLIEKKFLNYNQYQLNLFSEKKYLTIYLYYFLTNQKNTFIDLFIEDCKDSNGLFRSDYLATNIVALFNILSLSSIYLNLAYVYLPDDYQKKKLILENEIFMFYGNHITFSDNIEVVFSYFHPFDQKRLFYNFIKTLGFNEIAFLHCFNHLFNGGVDNQIEEIKATEEYLMYVKDKETKIEKTNITVDKLSNEIISIKLEEESTSEIESKTKENIVKDENKFKSELCALVSSMETFIEKIIFSN